MTFLFSYLCILIKSDDYLDVWVKHHLTEPAYGKWHHVGLMAFSDLIK